MTEIAELQVEVARIELQMLVTGAVEELRAARDLALESLRAAEAAAIQEPERVPTLEERWEFYRDCRIWGRRRMPARMKAKAIRWLGRRIYRSLPL